MLKLIWFWMTRYCVIVEWEGKLIRHWARDERDAREWMACYPDALAMYGKRGKLLGARWSN